MLMMQLLGSWAEWHEKKSSKSMRGPLKEGPVNKDVVICAHSRWEFSFHWRARLTSNPNANHVQVGASTSGGMSE